MTVWSGFASRSERKTHIEVLGEGENYEPALKIQSCRSHGLVHRVKGYKTGRTHHLLSRLELACFHLLDWSDDVIDIREQYPLQPIAETRQIAHELGVRYPLQRRKRRGWFIAEPMVITSDFRVTFSSPDSVWDEVISVKPAGDLVKKRTLDKLEIERRYWSRRSTPWRLVTERELPEILVANLKHLHTYRWVTGRDTLREDVPLLTEKLYNFLHDEDRPVGAVCAEFDHEFRLPIGTSIDLVWHEVAMKRWALNLNELLSPDKPLPGLTKAKRQPT